MNLKNIKENIRRFFRTKRHKHCKHCSRRAIVVCKNYYEEVEYLCKECFESIKFAETYFYLSVHSIKNNNIKGVK